LVIDKLGTVFDCKDVGIAFFYFDYRDQDNQSAADIVASMLKQLASLKSPLPRSVVEFHKQFEKQRDRPRLKDLETTLLLACREFRQTFIIIDALDECDAGKHRKDFLQVLKGLEKASVKLFITSRPHPDDIKRNLGTFPQITIEASDSDIRKYFTEMIDQDDAAVDLVDEHLKQEIVRDITSGAQGMLVHHFSRAINSDLYII
jgi:hypothetical protein